MTTRTDTLFTYTTLFRLSPRRRNPWDWCARWPTEPLLRGPWAVPPGSGRKEQAERLRGDALAATDEAQRFAGRGLDADRVDVDIKVLRDQRAHRISIRTDLRPLADHGDVGVAELPAALAQQFVAVADEAAAVEIGRAHGGTPVTNANLVYRHRHE